MSEIRNLTRNGETFYPLTTSSAVINESTGEGLIIDDVPTAGSDNLVKSGGVAEIYGDYEEDNPEFIRIVTDANKRILFGVNKNGNFYFGAGVPQQVIDYVEGRVSDLGLLDVESIVNFVDGLESGQETLPALLLDKVDKENGKSLINEEFASVQVIAPENPEWLQVIIDKDNRIIAGIRKDGSFENMIGVPTPTKEYIDKASPKKMIICTGDSVTEGSHLNDAGSANYDSPSYPAQLHTMMVDNGYDRYDVINQGNGGEELQDMVARTCGMMNYLTQDITLSNDESHWNDWVEISSYWARNTDNRKIAVPYKDLQDNDYKVCFTHAYGMTKTVFIDGNYYNFRTRGSSVTGEEGMTYDEIQKISQDNKTTLIPAGVSIITGTPKAPFISTIMGGHNRADSLNFAKWADMTESCMKTGIKGLVIGYHKDIWHGWSDLAGNDSTAEGRAERYADYHRKAIERFGVNFIDLWDEFYRHAMDYCLDAGYFSDLTPTRIAEMRADFANHILPVELSYDGAHQGDVHLSKEGYYVIAKLIFDKLVALKYIEK